MATITFKGNPISTNGVLPQVGTVLPNFTLTDTNLNGVTLTDWQGQKKIFNIVLSVDTPVCSLSTKKFNDIAATLENTVVLVVSGDLPFAQKRYTDSECTNNVILLSTFRSTFSSDMGIEIINSQLKGLPARAVLVVDENNVVIYSELVSEITQEPNYDAIYSVTEQAVQL